MSQLRKKSYDYLGVVQASNMSVFDGMDYLLTLCESFMPHDDYATLRQLLYEADVIYLRAWLGDVLTTEPPTDAIRAFYFGLYEPYLDDGQPTCQLYVSGSTRYNPDDRAGDWATWEEDSYIPQKRYANSSVLTQLYRLTRLKDHDPAAEFLLNLGYAILVVKEFCRFIAPEIFLGSASERVIAMGYDSGDLIPIGIIRPQGFQSLSWT